MSDRLICRIGVFYDGSYFQYAQRHYYRKRNLGWLQFRPLHELIEEYVRTREQGFATHKVVYAAWFQGLFTSSQCSEPRLKQDRALHHDLMHAGIEMRYLPMSQAGKEKGVDVALAVDALSVALAGQIDVAVLVSGDGDLVPLARALLKNSVRVVVGYFELVDAEGGAFANERLLSAASHRFCISGCENDRQFSGPFRALFEKAA